MILGSDIRIGQRESSAHDLARCILLAQVVLGHMAGLLLPTMPELMHEPGQNAALIAFRLFTRFGSQAAYLFVFLSGFMVGGPLILAARTGTYPPAATFFLKRMKRIVPIAFAALLLTAALDFSAIHGLGLQAFYRTAAGYDAVAELNLLNFVGNLAFLEPTFVHAFGSNGPLWTLGYIVQYYVLGYALLALGLVLGVNRRPWLALLALPVLAAMFAVKPEWAVLFLAWTAGGLARLVRLPRKFGLALGLVGVLVFLGSNVLPGLVSATASIVVGFCFVAYARGLREDAKARDSRLLKAVSAETYTIYAIHYPLLMFVAAAVFRSGASDTGRFAAYVALAICVVAVATVVISRIVDLVLRSAPGNVPSLSSSSK